jgi:hypothetical protein
MPRTMREGVRTRRQCGDSTGGKASSETASTRCFEHPDDVMDPPSGLVKVGARLIPLASERGRKIGGVAALCSEDCAVAASGGFGDSR